jgi:NADH dehydrogenase/NADH:ubiquinone oxidoreductase subunit G
MCLVQVGRSPVALTLSRSTPLSDKLYIYTNTRRVIKARESVMEFLSLNHPLDRAICDQGGECDSQDSSRRDGTDRGRLLNKSKRV